MINNFLVSGWPGAGASTVALIITEKFNLTLLRGTETFRYIGSELRKSDTGLDRINNDNFLEPIFGPVFDSYVDYKLINAKNVLVDADIGAFRIGKRSEYFSVFVAASLESRQKRLSGDNRHEDVEVLIQRQEDLRQHYKDLHNIDWFSRDEILKNYNLLLDNSDLTIAQELIEIYNAMRKENLISADELKVLVSDAEIDEQKFLTQGKKSVVEELKSSNRLMDAPEVLREIRELYKKEVESFPEKVKSIIYKL